MNLSSKLNSLANVSTGTARAVFESANAAFHAIFEGEEDELAELSELGDEIGDDLDAPADENPDADSAEATGEEGSEGDTGDEVAPEDAGDPSDDVTDEPEAPEQKPEDVNAESQPASISADALIKELIDLKYPEKIRVVAQQMKQTSNGSAPTASDMVRPVAQAISRYMAKKGYAAMAKDEAIRVVKTIVMAATDVGKSKQKQD